MAELDSSSHKGDGKKRSKKMSTKIDMTPMVDLAFLLVTFFILTITFSKPKTMQLVIPDKKVDTTDQTKVKESEALTIILGQNNHVFYYFGIKDPKVEATTFSDTKGIRQVLADFNDKVKRQQQALSEKVMGPVVLIKPMDKSKYDNLVAILDEMKITNVRRYALVDVTSGEEQMIKGAEDNAKNNNP